MTEVRREYLIQLRTFRITFGLKWRRELHPVAISGVYPHPDGWFEVQAHTWEEAQRKAMDVFRGEFAMCYTPDEYGRDNWEQYFPKGKLGEI